MKASAGVAGFIALLLAQSVSGQLATKKTLTLDAAKKIAAAGEAEAKKNNWTVVIAILDDGANLIYLERMDGTQIGSIEVAQFKGKSAVLFKRPTKAFEDRVTGGATNMITLPGAAPVEGGVPIMLGQECIGAIGVSGMTSQQDGVVAAAALAVAAKMQ